MFCCFSAIWTEHFLLCGFSFFAPYMYDNLKIGFTRKMAGVLLLLCTKFPVVWFQFLCTIHVNQVKGRLSSGTHHGFLLLYWFSGVALIFDHRLLGKLVACKVHCTKRGAIQKKRGIASLKSPSGPSFLRMEKTIICIDTGVPGGAVIIRVFITSNGVVTIAASPPDNAPTATVSHASKSLFKTCCAACKTNADIIKYVNKQGIVVLTWQIQLLFTNYDNQNH